MPRLESKNANPESLPFRRRARRTQSHKNGHQQHNTARTPTASQTHRRSVRRQEADGLHSYLRRRHTHHAQSIARPLQRGQDQGGETRPALSYTPRHQHHRRRRYRSQPKRHNAMGKARRRRNIYREIPKSKRQRENERDSQRHRIHTHAPHADRGGIGNGNSRNRKTASQPEKPTSRRPSPEQVIQRIRDGHDWRKLSLSHVHPLSLPQ